MNILAVSASAVECAEALDDVRLRKARNDVLHLLSTALIMRGGRGFRRLNRFNHPCSRWVRQTRSNYSWTLGYLRALCRELEFRFGVKDYSTRKQLDSCQDGASLIMNGQFEAFVNASKDTYRNLDYTHVMPTTRAYQMFLSASWIDQWGSRKGSPVWTKRGPPKWAPELVGGQTPNEDAF